MSTRIITAAEAAREALFQILSEDENNIVIGEGVPDPKAAFGTTADLHKKFPYQVLDSPVSENGVIGVCIGAALGGLRPIHVNMRQDFLLYAMDQIVNNAAKWNSMYGGQGGNVPMVIKAFTGRGWGAGHQHAQNLEAMFAHVPGLKVVCPSTPKNAKGLLIAAAHDPNPVLVLESRWVHPLLGEVPPEPYETKIGEAHLVTEGDRATIVTWGYSLTPCRVAVSALRTYGAAVDLLDLQTLRPMDIPAILNSVKKTRKLMVVNDAWEFGGIPGEIIARVAERGIELQAPPLRVTAPSFYPSSTPALTKDYYPSAGRILWHAANLIGIAAAIVEDDQPHDIPNPGYTGPF